MQLKQDQQNIGNNSRTTTPQVDELAWFCITRCTRNGELGIFVMRNHAMWEDCLGDDVWSDDESSTGTDSDSWSSSSYSDEEEWEEEEVDSGGTTPVPWSDEEEDEDESLLDEEDAAELVEADLELLEATEDALASQSQLLENYVEVLSGQEELEAIPEVGERFE